MKRIVLYLFLTLITAVYFCCFGQNRDLSFNDYLKLAEKGNAEAQFKLGVLYSNGREVQKDYGKAVEWYQKAANQNYAKAQYNLAICYEEGNGVPMNFVKAVEWYQKAAAQGMSEAQYNLGVCYYEGRGVKHSYEKAVEWFQKASNQGNEFAQLGLATCYKYGRGVLINKAKTVELLLKSANKGLADAQYNLGVCYDEGEGVAQNYQKAMEWYLKAASQGHVKAQYNIGVCYSLGHGVQHSYKKALEWFQKAADQGDEKAKREVENMKILVQGEQSLTNLNLEKTKSFPQYGFSITAPCELEDVSSQSSGNFLLNLGGVTDGNDPVRMAAYQISVVRAPVGYRDLPKEEYERMMDSQLRSLGRSFKYWNHISFGYEGYNGYVGETTHNGYGQKGVMFVKDNLIIALTVITNNNLEQKFNKFTNGFKTINSSTRR